MAQKAVAEFAFSPAPKLPARPIDMVHLAKQCLGDANLEREILRLFDTTVKTYFERLTLASGFDDMAMAIHSIKGAASGVGAWTIADFAKTMETDLRDGRPIRSERIDDLGMAIEEVRGFISRLLKADAA
jgi:HPt (histidine-containing phosphotransfer) domain-containing protein